MYNHPFTYTELIDPVQAIKTLKHLHFSLIPKYFTNLNRFIFTVEDVNNWLAKYNISIKSQEDIAHIMYLNLIVHYININPQFINNFHIINKN